MLKVLVVVDMQNDFIDGSLKSEQAQNIVANVVNKINARRAEGYEIILTKDMHDSGYLNTREGRNLPVPHCIKGTYGEKLNEAVSEATKDCKIFYKQSYGSRELIEYLSQRQPDIVEFIGLCTDICVITNVLGLKAFLPEAEIAVDPSCCAGASPEGHEAALTAMKSCNITIL